MIGWTAAFEEQDLVLQRYPLPRAGRSPRVAAAELEEVCVGWAPPSVRTRAGEFLFVPAPQARELAAFANAQGLPFVRRADVWSWLLDPFLDTEHPPEFQRGSLRLLAENGFLEDEVRTLRKRVEGRMLAMTAVTWEWVHYGLFDVLLAMQPRVLPAGKRFARFYDEAMAIADRGGCIPSDVDDFLKVYPEPG